MVINKKYFLFFIFLIHIFALKAESANIHYYGVFSNNIDANMSKMASDLYMTQLQEIQSFSILDMRNSAPLSSNEVPDLFLLPDDELSFYVEIKKDNLEKWFTTLHLINKKENKSFEKTIVYDSYYKILMESKEKIREYILSLSSNHNTNTSESNNIFGKLNYKLTSTESLSGTWKGEDNINKIVILRGGRGFVIFKNGASMNVEISFENNTDTTSVLVTQKGKSNASFFPEIPRQEALNAALTAEPIQWSFTAKDENTLIGTKKTIIEENGSYTPGFIEIEWKKQD